MVSMAVGTHKALEAGAAGEAQVQSNLCQRAIDDRNVDAKQQAAHAGHQNGFVNWPVICFGIAESCLTVKAGLIACIARTKCSATRF